MWKYEYDAIYYRKKRCQPLFVSAVFSKKGSRHFLTVVKDAKPMKRIILFGPPLAGKRTTIEVFAASRNAQVLRFGIKGESDRSKIPRTGDGKIMYVTPDEYSTATTVKNVGSYLTLGERDKEITVLTFSGAVWTEALWGDFISRANAIGVVLDSQSSCTSSNIEFIKMLDGLAIVPAVGCVMWTKQDIASASNTDDAVDHRLKSSCCSAWPVFRCSLGNRLTLLTPLDWLVSQV